MLQMPQATSSPSPSQLTNATATATAGSTYHSTIGPVKRSPPTCDPYPETGQVITQEHAKQLGLAWGLLWVYSHLNGKPNC